MAILIDITAIAIVVIAAFVGYKRGFVRGVIKLIGTIACVIFALVISDMASGPIYRNIVAPRLESTINKEMKDFDITEDVRKSMTETGIKLEMTDDQLRKILSDGGSIPSAFERQALDSGKSKEDAEKLRTQTEIYFSDDFGKLMLTSAGFEDAEVLGSKLDISSPVAYDIVRAFTAKDGLVKGIEYLVRNVIDKMMTSMIRYILFLVLFILAEIAVAIVFKAAGVLDHLPIIKGANKSLGLALGIIKGALYVLLAALIISALCESGAITDTAMFKDSFLFSKVFGLFYKM